MSRLAHLLGDATSPKRATDSPAWGYLTAWCQSLSLQNYASKTIETYQLAIRQFIEFVDADHHLDGDITACRRQDLARFFGTRLEEDGISSASAKLILSAIKRFYHYLIDQGIAAHDPTTGYRLKSAPRKLPSIADETLMQKLLDQPMPSEPAKARLWIRDKAMFELAYSSGLRVSELASLDIDDIDLDAQVLRVTGKGNKTRQVPIGSQACQALKSYLPHRDLWQEQYSPALFISERHGTRLGVRAIQLRLKACAASADIDQNLHPHLLRHCFASHLLSASGDLRAVQEMLGHSNISTTQIYTHVDFGALTRVYDHAHPCAQRRKNLS